MEEATTMNTIRAKVVCVLRNSDRMLLIRATDPHDGRSFFIPPGGGVEFGETLRQAIIREVQEEVGIELQEVTKLGMSENIFRFAGRDEHELVFIYEAACHDPDLCAKDDVEIVESNGERMLARWYTRADVQATGLPLFPEGLLDLLGE